MAAPATVARSSGIRLGFRTRRPIKLGGPKPYPSFFVYVTFCRFRPSLVPPRSRSRRAGTRNRARRLLPRRHLQTTDELRVKESPLPPSRAVRHRSSTHRWSSLSVNTCHRHRGSSSKQVRWCHDFVRRQAAGHPGEVDVFIH